MRAWVLIGLAAGCGATEPVTVAEVDDPAAAAGLREFDAALELTWRGQMVGVVRDRLRRTRDGFSFERRESWRAARGGGVIDGALALRIETDAQLEARVVEVSGGAGGAGRARRDGDAWVIEVEGEAVRRAPGDAVPAELVPLWMAQRGAARFDGPVLMSGMAFAPAVMTAMAVGDRELEVRVTAAAGEATTRVLLRADRTVERVVGGDLDAWRVDHPRDVGDPPDLVGLSALDVGALDARARGDLDDRAPPGPLPALAVPDPPVSPAVRAAAARVPGGAAALARAVAELVEDDLGGGPVAGADQVLSRRRGDCVAHAVLFSAMARARGIPVRLVTGFRLEGRALVRHQWAIVEENGERVAIDPTAGGAATPGRYLALAVHGSSAAERALAAELGYARFAASGPRSGRSTPRTP